MPKTNPVNDEIIRLVEGWRNFPVLFHALQHLKEPIEKIIFLEKYYPPYLVTPLLLIENWVRYQRQDYTMWYEHLSGVLERGEPSLSEPHDIDLEAYIKGMFERNYLIWYDIDMIQLFSFMKDKKVVDLGCGSGYYSMWFSKISKDVTAIDRPKMVPLIKKYLPEVYTRLTGEKS